VKNSSLNPSTKPMKRTKFSLAKPKPMKSKQLAVTSEEKEYWNRLATEVGCVACLIDGNANYNVSIHHIDGRTKPGCHKLVLPLCAQHHQHDDTDPIQRIGVHPWATRFEKKYGTQIELRQRCDLYLGIKNGN
jgi:hypothetical protein